VGDAVPALLFTPKGGAKAAPVLVVHPAGKSALLNGEQPGELVNALLARGSAVLAIDCFLTGEADKHDERLKEKFFTTFYRTDAAERVQDIVTALCYLRLPGNKKVDLIGVGNSGIDCLFARAFYGGSGATAIDAAQFDATHDQSFVDRLFVPSIRRVGDIRTAAAMIAPGRLTVYNAAKGFPVDWIRRAYGASGSAGNLEITGSNLTEKQLVSRL
jgi:hypothetical protein